jgi:membrane protease YdiL (CAAX protease family)
VKGNSRRADLCLTLGLLVYTAVVHTVDTFGRQRELYRALSLGKTVRHLSAWGFDPFKFAVWFLVPFLVLLALRRMDWGYFGVKRWRRADLWLLGGIVAAGVLAVLSILVVPSLRDWYPSMGDLPSKVRWHFAQERLVWTFSWIVGWEFLHRYALLTQLGRVWPRYGWLAIPVIEGVYHLQKDPLEMAGMVALSLVLTSWARARKNTLLPFLAHLSIEVELLLFQVLV